MLDIITDTGTLGAQYNSYTPAAKSSKNSFLDELESLLTSPETSYENNSPEVDEYAISYDNTYNYGSLNSNLQNSSAADNSYSEAEKSAANTSVTDSNVEANASNTNNNTQATQAGSEKANNVQKSESTENAKETTSKSESNIQKDNAEKIAKTTDTINQKIKIDQQAEAKAAKAEAAAESIKNIFSANKSSETEKSESSKTTSNIKTGTTEKQSVAVLSNSADSNAETATKNAASLSEDNKDMKATIRIVTNASEAQAETEAETTTDTNNKNLAENAKKASAKTNTISQESSDNIRPQSNIETTSITGAGKESTENTNSGSQKENYQQGQTSGKLFSATVNNSSASASESLNSSNSTVFEKIRIEEVAKTTAKFATQTADNSTSTARLVLRPESLGTVFVKVTLTGQKARLSIKADTQEALKTIEGQLTELRDKLSRQNLIAQDIELQLSERDSQSSGDGSGKRNGNSRQQSSQSNTTSAQTDFASQYGDALL